MSTSASPIDASIATRVRPEVERTLQRSIKGLNYLFSDDPALGQTPKDTIYKRGTLALYHYRPQAREVYRIPVLFVMSLVSKAYILDLAPGQSFIEFLLKQGYDVYLIDWGVPRPEDRHLKLEDYVLDFIPDCISQIMADSGERRPAASTTTRASIVSPDSVRTPMTCGTPGITSVPVTRAVAGRP